MTTDPVSPPPPTTCTDPDAWPSPLTTRTSPPVPDGDDPAVTDTSPPVDDSPVTEPAMMLTPPAELVPVDETPEESPTSTWILPDGDDAE